MRMAVFVTTRIVTTLGLVITIWFHAHWSVALAITGLSVACEFNFWILMFMMGVKRP